MLKPSQASTSIKRLKKEIRTKIFEKEFLHECGRNWERRLLLSLHSIAMTRFVCKNRGQEPRASVKTGCHGEVSCKTTWPSVSKQIASVTTFHRNDKGLATSSELSSRTQCELSWREALSFVAIYFLSSRTQCGDLSAMRLLLSFHSIAVTRKS